MHLVVVDLIPALLSWEGRDRSGDPDAAPGAAHALGHLFDHFQMIGVADAGQTAASLRNHLEREGLGQFFDAVVTTSAHGPRVSGRTVRRIAGAAAKGEKPIVVTARPAVADELGRARIAVVLTAHADFESVTDAVFDIADGRVNP